MFLALAKMPLLRNKTNSRLKRLINTTFTFVFGFGLGFFLSWVGAMMLTSVNRPGHHYKSYNDIIYMDRLAQPIVSEEVLPLDDFSSQAKILCYFLVDAPTHKGALHVKNTWAQRCDHTIFFSTKNDTKLGTTVLNVTQGYEYLWQKSMAAMRHLHEHFSEYDWFLKADDDTYIIVENLRYFLQGHDARESIYFGVKFKKHVKQGYMSGGGGYVFSRMALHKVVNIALDLQDQTLCPNQEKTGAEDLNLGQCFASVGVAAGESLDSLGKPRFFSHSPIALLYKVPLINHLHWYWKYIWHKHPIGPDCCSEHLISFHNVDPRMMWTLEFLLYRMTIHRDLQPSERNYSTSTLSPQKETSSSSSSSGRDVLTSSSFTTPISSLELKNNNNFIATKIPDSLLLNKLIDNKI